MEITCNGKLIQLKFISNTAGVYPTPTHCFICGGELAETKNADGKKGRAIICVNESCPGKNVELIRNWIKKTGIKNIGDEVLIAVTGGNNPIVNKISDLYKLTVDQLKDLQIGNGILGKSNATKIMMEIDKTRSMDMDLFIGSLGIKFLGRSMAKHIGYTSANDYINADVNDLTIKDNMGPNKARDMKASINIFKDIITELQMYVKIKAVVTKVNANGKFANVTMCFTGVRPTEEERNTMESLGIVEKSSVSKGLTYLVQKSKDSTSGKTEKALSYGTKILGYDEFKDMIK
jgi:DNA ligase (NAD+)